ncbi:MAG: 2,6-beta-D-fructofuranosidase [Bacteroidaceae bacterium]|nr:2,6-beta-D-fructofuranosidase [Bacteroidaceae bacterium]
MKTRLILSCLMVCSLSLGAMAQETAVKDSVPQTKEERNRNVMLNASSDNQPRQISIGLPDGEAVDIFEDGTPVSYLFWPDYPYYSWRGGASTASQSLMSLSESALQYGKCSYVLNSSTVKAGDQFQGLVNYTTNIFRKQVADINVSGPIAKGWGYMAGAYIGFDPGSNRLDALDPQDQMQIYKIGINNRFANGKGEMSLQYKYANYVSMPDNYGLFYYNGKDGSVDELEDFNLGRDQLLANYQYINYIDVRDGQRVRRTMRRANTVENHQITFTLGYNINDNMKLDISSKLKFADMNKVMMKLGGIFTAQADDGYTYTTGSPYTGTIQNRYMLYFEGFEKSWMTTAQLTGKTDNHSWRLALNEWYNRAGIYTATGLYAHEAKASPSRLLKDGEEGSSYNDGSEYYNGHENRLALIASDDWTINKNLWVSAGVRLEWMTQGGRAALAFTDDGQVIEPKNDRTYMYNLKDGVKNRFGEYSWFNPSATFNFRYTIANGFGLVGEYVYVKQRPNLQDYAGPYMPLMDPINVHMAKGGIYWNNAWMQLTSQISYINQTNYKFREQFTNPNDQSETVVLPIVNDVATLGWTTDAVFTPFKGFTFHGLLTLQNPKYKNFTFQPVFSDGPGQLYNFNDKNVIAMSKLIMELDPSYQWDKWRVWLSFRYQSKQYINRTNTLYFKGRWETFGGIDYEVNKRLSLSLNVINILNQKGASGNIPAADLATDVSAYQQHYLMSGTYIRPFTMEMTASLKF